MVMKHYNKCVLNVDDGVINSVSIANNVLDSFLNLVKDRGGCGKLRPFFRRSFPLLLLFFNYLLLS